MTNSNKREYKMTVAGQLFKHLGLQMYSGAVPVIVELISNAYDAMARNVWITLPVGRPIGQTDVIEVRDDGHGMNFEECNSRYLSVGRDRRSDAKELTKPYNGVSPRKPQGRKGIGKLAGFGMSNRIEVETIRNKSISHFAIDFNKLTRSPDFAAQKGYFPEPLAKDNQKTEDDDGTRIKLSQLKITRAIDKDSFRKSIARRMLVISDDFKIHVNGKPILRQEIPFQFRFPEKSDGWVTEKLPNHQEFHWWAGFCKDTIPEEERRGFVVYVRGKLAQTPWFFDLSGGVWGQHGMQYLTGEIKADFLDENTDLISTDRGSVRWEDPVAEPLKSWGQKKVKELLEQWTDKRREEKIKTPKIRGYLKLADKLPEREREIFRQVVKQICSIPQLDKDKDGNEIADALVEFSYNALTNRNVLDAIRKLNAASDTDLAEFTKVLSEWDIIELVNTAQQIRGRVEIIRKFKQMIQDKVREKPDMQDYVRDHPWLIDPKWTSLVHEKTLDTLLVEKFGVAKPGNAPGGQRFDFFCLGDKYKTSYVVEVKRPGKTVGKAELDQLQDYVIHLQRRLQVDADSEHRRETVRGLLIADHIRSGDQLYVDSRKGLLDVRTWDNVLTSTETLHEEFLEVIKERAPADDPRISDMDDTS